MTDGLPGRVERRAWAKINLYLRVLEKRPDGYHEIETLFQRVGLCDRVVLERTSESGGVALHVEGVDLGALAPEENLAVRALRAFEARTGRSIGGVRVTLEKRIPAGGGLGGGSADAAAVLAAAREMFAPETSGAMLHAVAAGIGADVPFFLLDAEAAVGRGVGERLTTVAHGARFHAVLALPDVGCSTAAVYRRWADAPGGRAEDSGLSGLLEALERENLEEALALTHNDLEGPAFAEAPALADLQERLTGLAGRTVRLTGSGSTLFTLCRRRETAQETAETWRRDGGVKAVVAPFPAAG